MIYNLANDASRALFLRDADRMAAERHKVTLGLCRDRRSVQQNRLYWLWLACIADETGNDRDALHEYFKCKYLSVKRYRVAFESGIESGVVRESTASLDSKGMTLYLDCIHQFALAECGIALPRPQEQGWEEFHEKYISFIG